MFTQSAQRTWFSMESIETTDAKAKELRRVAEKLITRCKRIGKLAYTKHDDLSAGDQAKRLAAQRVVGSFVTRFGTRVDKEGESTKVDLVEKIFCDLCEALLKNEPAATRGSSSSVRVVVTAAQDVAHRVRRRSSTRRDEKADGGRKNSGKAKSKKATRSSAERSRESVSELILTFTRAFRKNCTAASGNWSRRIFFLF